MMSIKARIICFFCGLVLFSIVSFLVRRRRLNNVYAISWFLISMMFLCMGVFPESVDILAAGLGINFQPAAILVAALGGVMVILLHLSMIVTEQHKQIRNFEKELALAKVLSPAD